MKLEGLDAWFENEKNDLVQEYMDRLQAGESSESIRDDFDKRMTKAIATYQETHINSLRPHGVKKAQAEWNKKVIDKIYDFMDSLTKRFKE